MSLKNLNTWVRKNMGASANFVYIRAQTRVTFGGFRQKEWWFVYNVRWVLFLLSLAFYS